MDLILPPPIPIGRPVTSGGAIQYSIPGVEVSQIGTAGLTANIVRYSPLYVLTPIVLDQYAIETTVAGAAATTMRMGIYHAGPDWQAGDLVVDCGTVAADGATGVRTKDFGPTLLAPGRYLAAFNTDASVTVRVFRGGTMFFGLATALGASAFASYSVAQAYAAMPTPGTQWTAATGGSTPPLHAAVWRVSTP